MQKAAIYLGGGTRKAREGQWTNWKLRVTHDNKVHLQVPDTDQSRQFQDSHYLTIECKNSKIASKLKDQGQEVNVVANSSEARKGDGTVINFELKDSPSCRNDGSERKECEIVFGKDINLSWAIGFTPKAYFYY